jgi:hypothetical protein
MALELRDEMIMVETSLSQEEFDAFVSDGVPVACAYRKGWVLDEVGTARVDPPQEVTDPLLDKGPADTSEIG